MRATRNGVSPTTNYVTVEKPRQCHTSSTLVHWQSLTAVYCAYMKQMRLPSTGWQHNLLAHDNNKLFSVVIIDLHLSHQITVVLINLCQLRIKERIQCKIMVQTESSPLHRQPTKSTCPSVRRSRPAYPTSSQQLNPRLIQLAARVGRVWHTTEDDSQHRDCLSTTCRAAPHHWCNPTNVKINRHKTVWFSEVPHSYRIHTEREAQSIIGQFPG